MNQRIIGWCRIYIWIPWQLNIVTWSFTYPTHGWYCPIWRSSCNSPIFPIWFYSFAGFLPSTVTSFVESSRSLCLWSSELLKRGRSSGDQWQRSGNVLVASHGQNRWVLLGRMVHMWVKEGRTKQMISYETSEATMKLRDYEAIHVFQVFFRWVGSTTNYFWIVLVQYGEFLHFLCLD